MGPNAGNEWDDSLWKLLVKEVDANSDGQVRNPMNKLIWKDIIC